MKIEPIKVEYVDHFGSDLSVVNAARVSFDKVSTWDVNQSGFLKKRVLKKSDASLINFLARGFKTQEWDALIDEVMSAGHCDDVAGILRQYKASAVHFAPFCHASVTLRLTVPVFVARQLVKHQIGMTWSEVSRRYVSDEPSFWFPDVWHTRPEDVKQGSGDPASNMPDLDKKARAATESCLLAYEELLAEGVAPEEARIVLPLNHMTTVIWTGTLLAWSRVCNQRLDPHAQGATQEAAKSIRDIVQPLFPVSWEALVAY